ncbi:EF-P 5-aminopentanol modification-associated protein YfmH [Lacticaseibacillus zhaodongensis]|uniref:EF-P 5-aminopentanol modification-associated protein YfmH n=1 Tax=Lacticaseibacillus zhaodongensis TaxID=2668065 RepID=UPI0012D3500E|nr:pitrilysin family protein [Lacticaseibacillus zhaodongensis]
MLKTEDYSQSGEVVQTDVLDNGLHVQYVYKPDYHKTYAMFTTNFGSIDNSFRLAGDEEFTRVPAGTAHFLEHKLFDKEDYDAFDLFGKTGASANAFTSATQTSYLFSTTDHVAENVDILLSFVQDPYFTDATVEKEKGIIGQEIQMYQDDADWQLYSGILGNLYPTHPLHVDVAGSIDSIATITPDMLKTVHAAFYQPRNMTLTVVGNFDVDAIHNVVQANQAKHDFSQLRELERGVQPDYAADSILPYRMQTLPISRSKAIVGVKGLTEIPDNRDGLRQTFAVRLLLEMIFGDSGAKYLDLYDQGVIDESFFYEFTTGRGFNYITLGGDSADPAQLSETLINVLTDYKDSPDFTPARFEVLKRAAVGKFFASLNSLENIANQLASQSFSSVSPFLIPEVVEGLTFADVQNAAEMLVRSEAISVFHIHAEEEQ